MWSMYLKSRLFKLPDWIIHDLPAICWCLTTDISLLFCCIPAQLVTKTKAISSGLAFYGSGILLPKSWRCYCAIYRRLLLLFRSRKSIFRLWCSANSLRNAFFPSSTSLSFEFSLLFWLSALYYSVFDCR